MMKQKQGSVFRANLYKTARSFAVVYLALAVACGLLLTPLWQTVLFTWLQAGILILALGRITPMKHRIETIRFWIEEINMALLWPLILYWIVFRGATRKRRDFLAEMRTFPTEPEGQAKDE